ncbi:tetratricopeptide repeat-containing sensor histidine kinase [Fulvivirga sedimenti]|uniref:histidine kinase n=1 Tax=Fulvivirga sedimenti TaxID=2879465 RepID=A0A9X1KW87_9BACT|nr:tetratricopeptide repeat protein [Fulvivirga sedimenti]MCA6073729.1 tetratricopeptide repeat-containing sensor histidine kinase [Fulvivirga sedimenti]
MPRAVSTYFLALIFLAIPFVGFPQDYLVIDSLKEELIYAENENRREILFSLSWEYRKSQPDSTLYYLREIMSMVDDKENGEDLPKVFNFMGVAYHYKGDDLKAYEYYQQAYDLAMNQGDSMQVAHSLNNMGRFYSLQGDHARSYDDYIKAIEIFEKLNDKDAMSYGYKSLAELYLSQSNYDKALQMTQKALELRESVNNTHGQISVLNEMAEIYMKQGDFEKVVQYYEESMLRASAIQDFAMMSNIYLGMADAYCMQDRYELALAEARKAQKIERQINNQDLENRTNLIFGKLLFRLNRFAESEAYFDELMVELENSNDLSLDREASYYQAMLYKATGRNELAFDKFRRHHELDKTLESAENARLIERLEARIEIESKEKENQLLMAENAMNEATEARLRMQNVLLLVGILAAAIIVLILYLMNKKRLDANRKLIQKNNFIAKQREEIKNQNEQIAHQNEKLRSRNERLKALNNEKDTLMNILAHDLKAPFNRIKGLTQLMELTDLTEEQRKYTHMLDNSTINGLNLIRDLLEVSAFSDEERKPSMSELSLINQLNEKKENFRTEAESKHIKLKVLLDDDIFIPADPSYLSRILDNLISNAIKFSNPGKEVILSGGKRDGVPYVSVKDFGPGFSEKDRENLYHKFARLSAQPTAGESSNGLGLAIVKILVDSLEGEIELISKPGEGSEFIIRFPAYKKQEEILRNK